MAGAELADEEDARREGRLFPRASVACVDVGSSRLLLDKAAFRIAFVLKTRVKMSRAEAGAALAGPAVCRQDPGGKSVGGLHTVAQSLVRSQSSISDMTVEGSLARMSRRRRRLGAVPPSASGRCPEESSSKIRLGRISSTTVWPRR